MGFVFKERLQSSVVLDMLGQEVTYEVLNVMEYSSDRWVSILIEDRVEDRQDKEAGQGQCWRCYSQVVSSK